MPRMAEEYEHQPYDSALKSLIEDHAAEMLPELIPGSEFVSEQKTEVVRNKLFPDLVLSMRYRYDN